MCAMLLADLGATVLRVDRKEPVELGIKRPLRYNLLLRNRKSIALDLKDPRAVEVALELIGKADALIEGFRPGVTERLGLGPEPCLRANPKLIYGRMTGWGQNGPLARTAGHDIGYIALTGVLNAIGRQGQPPSIPLNVVGDYAGGSLYLALGIVSAILECRSSGRGQVIDAAIVDGTASLATTFYGMQAAGMLRAERGSNTGDSGSHFYEVYECADGKWMSVGPIEPKFYALFLKLLKIDPAMLGNQTDPTRWPQAKIAITRIFRSKTRAEWTAVFAGSDACVVPVLDWQEATEHPYLAARNTFIEVDGIRQPAPAPRFSRTVPDTPTAPASISAENTAVALSGWVDAARLDHWRSEGILDGP
jgi:alpha-methylacyl-CoA racemase